MIERVFSYIGTNITTPGEEDFPSVGPGYALRVRNTVTGAVADIKVGFFDTEKEDIDKLCQSAAGNTADLFWVLLNDIRYELNWDINHTEFVPQEGNNGAEDFIKAAEAWCEFLDAEHKKG